MTPHAVPPRLELAGICKSYPAVIANDHVSLTVAPGEIHAVLGENGAGKSTLMKIIFGAVKPDAGQMRWNGEEVRISSPQMARQLGVAMVFQHFSLFDTLTVTENIALGLHGDTDLQELARQIRETGATYGLELEPERHVHTLSVGERQRVEIVRALLTKPQLLILDEPTSVLTPQAVQKLFVTLRQIAAEGCSILYISHKLDEIRELCHSATVMRAGKVTGHCDPRQETAASLSRLMTGAETLPQARPATAAPGEVRLAVQALAFVEKDLVDRHALGEHVVVRVDAREAVAENAAVKQRLSAQVIEFGLHHLADDELPVLLRLALQRARTLGMQRVVPPAEHHHAAEEQQHRAQAPQPAVPVHQAPSAMLAALASWNSRHPLARSSQAGQWPQPQPQSWRVLRSPR